MIERIILEDGGTLKCLWAFDKRKQDEFKEPAQGEPILVVLPGVAAGGFSVTSLNQV